jgi:hypothetical protein
MLPGYSRQANSMNAHVLLPLAVNSKSERKFNSLPLLGFEPVIFGMLAHLSDRLAKPHLQMVLEYMKSKVTATCMLYDPYSGFKLWKRLKRGKTKIKSDIEN